MTDQTSHEPNYCARHDLFDCWLCPKIRADEAPARQHPGGITLRCWLHEDDQICPDCTS